MAADCMDSLSKQHIEKGKYQVFLVTVLSISTIFLAIFALGQGSSSNLDMWTTMRIVLGLESESELQSDIIWKLRFPRILMAIIGGIALATAGALMQGCLGNPLVSPLTLGVASGAALGAAFAIVLGFTIVNRPELGIVANAFLFSLVVVYIIIQLGNFRSVSAESYILVGIAITFIAGAIVSTMQYFATDAQLSQLAHWSFGSLSRPEMVDVVFIGFVVFLLLPQALIWSWDLNALSLGGDDFAISTGVNPATIRRNILVLSALMTSVVIAFTGLIGFVGLAAPHMARQIVGNDFRKLIPCSAVFGAFLMLFADTLGRTLFAPIVIPVGIMLSVIGGPFFMYLLLKDRGVKS
ncbi:MAG TPA: iron ABC transporter permease [Candidatus Thalassarchaeaceae archaeon]|nr:iron ABC transporter permease [Candidatus Thalassarchaeaceae archaeon]|tara:strand:- start:2990 stop:4048 length:1059 start_codon:yes stop_codon:yes gene_type:complete